MACRPVPLPHHEGVVCYDDDPDPPDDRPTVTEWVFLAAVLIALVLLVMSIL